MRGVRRLCSASESSMCLKDKLIAQSLVHMPQYGFTDRTLHEAAKSLDYSPAVTGVLVNGPADVIHHVMEQNAETMKASVLKALEDEPMGTTDIIRLAVKTRLELQAPYIHHWAGAMAVGIQPGNAFKTTETLGKLFDDIWVLAGDKSTDINWYSKRAILGGVYAATELHMLTDKSDDFKDTWEFLDRRLEDVHSLGQAARSIMGQFK